MAEMIHLRIVKGPHTGREYSVPESGALLGRSSACDIVIHDGKLSRHHCRFLYRGGKLTVNDLESSNGTMVNGQPVRESRLKTGDILSIGDTEFEVVHDDLRPPLVFKREDPMFEPAPPSSQRRRKVPFLVAGPAWLVLIAWFLFLAYSLIPRGEAPAGDRPAGTEGSSAMQPAPATPAPGGQAASGAAAAPVKAATLEELTQRLRSLTEAVAQSLVKEDYDAAQELIRKETSLPSSLPIRNRIELLAASVASVKEACQSIEEAVLKLTGKEMAIVYKGRTVRVIPRAIVNGKITFSLVDQPAAPHLSLAASELAASDRIALLGKPILTNQRILRCALLMKSGNLAEARRAAPACYPFDEAFTALASK